MNIAVFVSGRGTNLQSILDSELLKGKVAVKAVISNLNNCGAFKIAEKYSIPVFTVGKQGISFEFLKEFLDNNNIELLVLAGYLKLIPDMLLDSFQNRIINIHPALLPSFGGAGMYGINVHKAVFSSSAKVSGATVHFVNKEYDRGMIIAQRCIDISDAASPEEIAERVLKIEHFLLPYVIAKFVDGKIIIKEERVIVLE